ncbi:NosL domain-containing protein [Campylobacter blaseri]|uniref:NosL family protein n=1 Tax=Campylobacter blaseri TaxID=2042961 RepID=A0A2P8R1D7_9BACT|nr:nitrous oxide reductase accessory protein NosL [Campylobacter blaseri]PSM52302.1 hypothetical protein CQ405_04415 [Campylobacter blaseri]PSM54068.1 hypothetical protein CRN67_04415 [Campylobacter blaseri]QKF85509.1 NosL domain-containing protein [Campylobacter blaseri]
MKRRFFLKSTAIFATLGCTSSFFLSTGLFANDKKMDFRVVSLEKVTILQDGESKNFCSVCGMSLNMFYKTNHAVNINGKTHQYCSIHCMHQEAMLKKILPDNPKVVDTASLKFIDATTAIYVYSSSMPATMSSISSYAFKNKEDAKKFQKKFGGSLLTYEEVSNATQKTLEDDIKLIDRRQSMAARRGEKIYKATCIKIDKKFSTPAEAKAYILKNNVCPNLTQKELSQVAHYLTKK